MTIRAVDFQKLDMVDAEFEYYQQLVQSLSTDKTDGSLFFHGLFLTDEKGIITIVRPTKPVPWEVMFFIQNLMINQHLRELDERMVNLEKGIKHEQ